ncbi:MAG: AAA family ATPase, partial [Desulfobacterales bacterium]
MIKRRLFTELIDHLSHKEMSLIIGPRQAGKTTLMEMLKANLDNSNQQTLFLNLDIEWDRPHFENQAALLR